MNYQLLQNNHKLHIERNSAILSAIDTMRALDAKQIELMFFSDRKSAKRIAERQLLGLFKNNHLSRGRKSLYDPYYYFMGRQPSQIDHILAVNWIYIWLQKNIPSGWKEIYWNGPEDCGKIKPDGLYARYGHGGYRFDFVELDNATSHNEFTKVKQYNDLFERFKGNSNLFWWGNKADAFPGVLVATTTLNKAKIILDRIEKENRHDLEFNVYLLDDIKMECIKGDKAKCYTNKQNIIVWRGF